MITLEEKNNKILLFTLTLTLLCLGVFSLFIGKYEMSATEVLKSMFFSSSEINNDVFWVLRFPRTLMVVFGGIALGVAGCVYQIIFKNPLASPEIIGVSSGANLGACFAIICGFSFGFFEIAIGSFIGAILSAFSVIIVAELTKSHSTTTYVLIGIVINAFARALIMVLKYFVDSDSLLLSVEYWEMGTFSAVSKSSAIVTIPCIIIALTVVLLFRRKIEMLSLSDNEARSLGVRIKPFRVFIISFTTLLVSCVISVTGLISFVSLISPHIARLLTKKNNSTTLLFSGILGGILTTISDILVRIISVTELPISIITAFFGLPVLIIFVLNRRKSRE